MKFLVYLSMAAGLASVVFGQTVVEHSVATSAASATAAGANGAGKSIGGVFKKLNATLDKAPKSESKTGTAEKIEASADDGGMSKPVLPAKFVDPAEVSKGLARAELIQRFGEPLLSVIDPTGSQPVERMWYPATAYTQIEIRVIAGKVASVQNAPK